MPRKVKLLYLSPLALQFDEFFHNLLKVKTTPPNVKLLYLSPLALQFDEFFHIYQIYPLLRNGLTGVFSAYTMPFMHSDVASIHKFFFKEIPT